MIRSDALPQEIAACLSQNLHQLQDRGLISSLEVDEVDLVSLGLQGLFSHRGKRATFISKDQTNYNGSTSKNRATHCSDTSSNHPDGNANDDLTSVNQDFHSFIQDASLASPVTTEASGSLCFEDTYATTASSYKRPASNGGVLHNSVANGPFKVQGKKSRGSNYSPSTLDCSISKEAQLQSMKRYKTQYTPPVSTASFERSDNLQSPTYNTVSSNERMYTAYGVNGHGVVGERVANEHIDGYSSVNSTPVSGVWGPPMDWHAQQWAYGVGEAHPLMYRNADIANLDRELALSATHFQP